MKRLLLGGTALILALSSAASAQVTSYTLNNANARWVHSSLNPLGTALSGGSANKLVQLPSSTTDQFWSQWWWIRVDGDDREYAFNNQTAFNQISDNEAELTYEPRPGIQAELRYRLVGSGSTGGQLTIRARLTNLTGAPVSAELFYYQDLYLAGTLSADTVTVTAPNQISAVDGQFTSVTTATPTPIAAAVGFYSTVLNALNDATLSDVVAAAGPYTGDDGGAFQWSLTLNPNQSVDVNVQVVTTAPLPPPVVSLTDGDARFVGRETTTGRTSTAGSSDLIAGTLDDLWRTWWYFNTDSTTREFGLSKVQSTTQLAPNEHRLVYNESTEGLRFELVYKLTDTGDDMAVLKMDYTVTNTAAQQQSVSVFNYTDMDVSGTSGNDTAGYISPGVIKVTDGTRTVNYLGVNPTNYLIASSFPSLLTNSTIDDFDNTVGAAADVGAGYQWKHVLAAGASATGTVFIAVNTELGGPAVPGDTDSSGCVDDADLTNIILDFGGAGGNTSGFAGTDINNDGTVDDADLTDLILNFGTGC